MTNNLRPTVGFIGLGKVGQTLARLLHQRGYRVSALWNRHPEAAVNMAEHIGAQIVESPFEVVQHAAITFLTVSDDALPGLASTLTTNDLNGSAVIHTSGALDLTALSSLQASGAMIGSLHPAFPFADVESAVASLDGAVFALEASDEGLNNHLRQIVADLNGQVIKLGPGDKVLYHAALVMVSNYGVTLYALAHDMLQQVGASGAVSKSLLDTLLSGMLHNLRTRTPAEALTGPLVRGDTQTVRAHLHVLQTYNAALYDLYRHLGLLTLPLVESRGTEVAPLRQLLQKDHHDTLDHS